MKKLIFIAIFLSSFFGLLSSVPVSFAQDKTPADQFQLTVAVENPLGNDKKEIKDIVASILNVLMDIVLPIVIVMVIYSGFLYVMARGKPEAIETAHKTLTWTLIGAAILLGAQLISTILIDTVSNISKDAGVTQQK